MRRVLIQAHRPAQIILIYFDGDLDNRVDRKIRANDGCGPVAVYIAYEVLTCYTIGLLSYFIVKPPCKPFRHFSKDPISSPVHDWSPRKLKHLSGTFNVF